MAPSDPSDTVLAVCLRVRQSGALRVFVALGRIILDLWAAPPQCGYWGSIGSFCSAPQDFGLLGFFCARFPPREARDSPPISPKQPKKYSQIHSSPLGGSLLPDPPVKSKRKIKTPNSQTLSIVVFAARTPRTCFPQPKTTIPIFDFTIFR